MTMLNKKTVFILCGITYINFYTKCDTKCCDCSCKNNNKNEDAKDEKKKTKFKYRNY